MVYVSERLIYCFQKKKHSRQYTTDLFTNAVGSSFLRRPGSGRIETEYISMSLMSTSGVQLMKGARGEEA
jgi:hypothetical protein